MENMEKSYMIKRGAYVDSRIKSLDWASRLTPYHHLKPKVKIGVPNPLVIVFDYGSEEFF
jgi:hypothetical protein